VTEAGPYDAAPPISEVLPVRVEPTDWLDGDLPSTVVFDQTVPVENGGFDELLTDSEFDVTN